MLLNHVCERLPPDFSWSDDQTEWTLDIASTETFLSSCRLTLAPMKLQKK